MKIYGCRVDDTLNTGYRILDSLSRGEQPVQSADVPKQSKRLGVINTLETNLSSLEMDLSDLAFDADPMFHLMSRRFDEGGAKGLLMANLGLTDGCTIVFDSNDVIEIPTDSTTPEIDSYSGGLDTFVDVQSILTSGGHTTLSSMMDMPVCPSLNQLVSEICEYEGNVSMDGEFDRRVN